MTVNLYEEYRSGILAVKYVMEVKTLNYRDLQTDTIITENFILIDSNVTNANI